MVPQNGGIFDNQDRYWYILQVSVENSTDHYQLIVRVAFQPYQLESKLALRLHKI